MAKIKALSIFSFVIFMIVGCNDDKKSIQNQIGFNRDPLLLRYAEGIILPNLQLLKTKVDSLNTSVVQFETSINFSNFKLLQSTYKNAALQYANCDAYNFGPGLDANGIGLSENLNTFPANTSLIESNISSSNFSTANFNRDTRGFPAIDYLLFDLNGVDSIAFNNLKTNTSRIKYLKSIIADLKTKTDKVLSDWQIYKSTFLERNGTDAASSVSSLYNEWIHSFEISKNYRLALPLGKRAGQTTVQPELLEAYYSGYSFDLLKQNMISFQNLYYGIGPDNVNGVGLDDFLKAVSTGSETHTEIENSFKNINAIITKYNGLKMKDNVISNDPNLNELHTELLKLTRFVKSEMSSKLGISITYSSGDGD
ncbi:MAG: imelysin family protein [Bacteroidota bacterium]|nr:imelysin family protein [Bacteroidota bacterium]